MHKGPLWLLCTLLITHDSLVASRRLWKVSQRLFWGIKLRRPVEHVIYLNQVAVRLGQLGLGNQILRCLTCKRHVAAELANSVELCIDWLLNFLIFFHLCDHLFQVLLDFSHGLQDKSFIESALLVRNSMLRPMLGLGWLRGRLGVLKHWTHIDQAIGKALPGLRIKLVITFLHFLLI